MSKTFSNAAFLLIGSVSTCAVLMSLGASHPTSDNAQYHVDFDIVDFGAKQLTIEITDSKQKKAYLYVIPSATKANSRGDSPIVKNPPRLVATIDLASAGDNVLDAEVLDGFLPVQQSIEFQPVNDVPKVPNFKVKD